MAVRYTTHGECLEAICSGELTRAEALEIWDHLARGIHSGLIDLQKVTHCLEPWEIEKVARKVKRTPHFPLAFVCDTAVKHGSVRMMAALTDLGDGYQIFQNREQAVAWLGSPAEA